LIDSDQHLMPQSQNSGLFNINPAYGRDSDHLNVLPSLEFTQFPLGVRYVDEQLSDAAAGLSYGTSIGSFGYWFLQLLDPSQWAAIGVLGSLL